MGFYRGPKIVTDGLVLYLDAANPKSYPGTGTTWSDLSGNGNDGTLINGPTFSNGNNGSIVFDGVNDYVNIGSDYSYNNLTLITINTWVYEQSPRRDGLAGGNTMILSNSRDCCGTYYGFDLKSSRGTILCSLWNGTSTSITSPYVTLTDKWYNITITYDGVNIKMFINSENVRTVPKVNAITGPATASLKVGAMGLYPNYNYLGKIPLTSIYNRALTAQEILQNYNATKSRFGL